MEIVEFNEKYTKDVKNLFRQLQEYIVSLDPYQFNVLTNGYEDKVFKIDMQEIDESNGKVFLAIDKEKVIGFIMGIIHEPEIEYDFIRNSRMGEITELIVDKNVRSKGIGMLLIKKMEAYFKEQGCKTINIDVFGYNDIAKNFYYKNGYHDRMNIVSKRI